MQPVATRPIIPTPSPAGARNPLAGLLANPGVFQADLNRQKTIGDANAMLRQARSQALISYGDADLARSLGDTVDANTAAAAAQNQFSQVAGANRRNTINSRRLMNSLAGRGLLHSGETGYQQGQQALQFGQERYDSQAALLAQLNQYLNQYLGQTQGAQDTYTQALLQAFGQLGQNPLGLIGG